MSVPQSEMLEELARRAGEEGGAPPLEGEHIPHAEADPAGFDFDPLELTSDTLELLLQMAAPNWLAESTPEEIRITRAKIEKLGKVYFATLVHYLPMLFEKYPLIMACAVQSAVVVMPLVKSGVPPRIQKKPAPAAEEKKNATDAAPPAP
jgi:hypothetical protein